MELLTPVSPGELLDKLTILDIKAERIDDAEKRSNVLHERQVLEEVWDEANLETRETVRLRAELKRVNEALWEIEDAIRECERDSDFGPRFIELARAVYKTNDRRAAVKRAINETLDSTIIEEKSYKAY